MNCDEHGHDIQKETFDCDQNNERGSNEEFIRDPEMKSVRGVCITWLIVLTNVFYFLVCYLLEKAIGSKFSPFSLIFLVGMLLWVSAPITFFPELIYHFQNKKKDRKSELCLLLSAILWGAMMMFIRDIIDVLFPLNWSMN